MGRCRIWGQVWPLCMRIYRHAPSHRQGCQLSDLWKKDLKTCVRTILECGKSGMLFFDHCLVVDWRITFRGEIDNGSAIDAMQEWRLWRHCKYPGIAIPCLDSAAVLLSGHDWREYATVYRFLPGMATIQKVWSFSSIHRVTLWLSLFRPSCKDLLESELMRQFTLPMVSLLPPFPS